MFQLIAAMLLGSSQTPVATSLQVTNLPSVFAATCLDGGARLTARDVRRIGFDDLPPDLRSQLGQPASSDVWRLNTSGNAYLYVLNYASQPGMDSKICGLASDQISLNEVADLLDLRLTGAVQPERQKSMQWLRPQDGYVAMATAAGKLKVAQVNWLNDQDRAEAIDQLSSVSP